MSYGPETDEERENREYLENRTGTSSRKNRDGTTHRVVYDKRSPFDSHVTWNENDDGDYAGDGHTTEGDEVTPWSGGGYLGGG